MRWILFFFAIFSLHAEVQVGLDVFLTSPSSQVWKGKKLGLLTNQTGVNQSLRPILPSLQEHGFTVHTLFAAEHGFQGNHYAGEGVKDDTHQSLVIYSLHGKTRRPTLEMFKGLDALIYDIQCVGVRPYTYETSLFYVMEEAAKIDLPVIVLDRPNPIGGITLDGPMLEASLRSFIGYINVPYCHGMTIGELAQFFNAEYQIGCNLTVVAMKGWNRNMTYAQTGLTWIPPSPNIPEADTPLYQSTTGALGELREFLNIGIGYTLPFKLVGAPWIHGAELADKLNAQKLPGVAFVPFYFRPFYGAYKGTDCQGVLIRILDPLVYRPIATQYLILGMLKSLYPQEVEKRLKQPEGLDLFHKANGTAAIFEILMQEKYPAWKLIEYQHAERDAFRERRKPYLLY